MMMVVDFYAVFHLCMLLRCSICCVFVFVDMCLSLLRARILRKNLQAESWDPGRTFIRQDFEGADCQVYFNDPEEADSHEGRENFSNRDTSG